MAEIEMNLKPAIKTADYADGRGYHENTEYPIVTRRETCRAG